MIRHPKVYLEQLTDADVDAIYEAALRILDEVGLAVQSARACRLLSDAGADVDLVRQHVRFPADLVEQRRTQAPARWVLEARSPDRSVRVGGEQLLVSPGYGSAFVADVQGKRRRATLADFRRFALLAGEMEAIDITGGLLVEPSDVAPRLRPLETTLALLTCSDKPFLGSVAGAEGAQESLRLAEAVFGGLKGRHVVMGLININSPLRLDATMAGTLLEYAAAGQPVLLTPGIMMGITAPVTAEGALAQALAELLAGVVLVQVVRPGTPVVVGTGGFGADLRCAGSGFGRPENAIGTVLGAQMARHLNLPFRCSAAVTGARSPDCRSGYERMLTALSAWAAGAHLCLQGAGTLDNLQAMCPEQFLLDCEVWNYVKRLGTPPAVDAEHLALEAIPTARGSFLDHEHTLAHFREALYAPLLAPADSYEAWMEAGGEDVVGCARRRLAEIEQSLVPPSLDRVMQRELERYAAVRRRQLQ